ncbi:MAG: hypothetical protein IPF92_20610 [Myxococcales bacterium]|nr:hypothetical protein [Myxococcales bacterium]
MTLLRLYRGLKGPYDPARAIVAGSSGVDFTDCPLTALLYAHGPRGVVLVVDVEPGDARVTEELWLGQEARRFMFWGRSFAAAVTAEIPAKELRAQLRKRGIVTASPPDRANVLRWYIADRLRTSGAIRA